MKRTLIALVFCCLATTVAQSQSKEETEVVAAVEHSDLALIRTKGANLRPLQLGATDEVRVGEEVIAIGQPFGLEGPVTKGIVSALRSWNGVRVIQVDVAINVGNSGGPLVNSTGKVIGVNSQIISKMLAEGIAFSVSSDEVLKAFSRQLSPLSARP